MQSKENASAVLIIVPKLPGSCTWSNIRTLLYLVISSCLFSILHTAITPCVVTVSVSDLKTFSDTIVTSP